jgi:hypothetical protein
MAERKKRQAEPLKATALLSAFVLAAVLLLYAGGVGPSSTASTGDTAEIAVEHSSAITLTLRMSTGKSKGIADVSSDGNDGLRVSVPAQWQRRDVRGAALSAVTSDPPSFGFRRWHLPAGATLSFWIGDPAHVRVRNPSETPVLVLAKRINVVTGKTDEKSVLIKEGTADLW